MGVKLLYPGSETCFAPSTREAGWDAKHISKHREKPRDVIMCLEHYYAFHDGANTRVLRCGGRGGPEAVTKGHGKGMVTMATYGGDAVDEEGQA